MDALKSAGRAIIRSPSMAKQSWTSGRHRKLPENWTDTRETILEGMTFNLRHLGMTLVDQPRGEDLSAAAVKRIVATAKASGKKPQKVALKVSPQGIVLYDSLNNKLLENVSIYRISYCTVDKLHDKVFAYITQNTLNGTLECHAYLCPKRKVVSCLTTVSVFLCLIYEWLNKEAKGKRVKSGSAGEGSSSSRSERSNSLGSLKGTGKNKRLKLFLKGKKRCFSSFNHFLLYLLRLAVSRSNPQVLDIGVTPQDWLTEPNWDSTNGNTPHGLSPFGDDIFGF
uniref:Low density lipoprotein receptor adaptor protein 1a n=1 Tax=Seriola lalandi dorsalis TaxID=1841481 RepID=A0A3B4WN51_SERLL